MTPTAIKALSHADALAELARIYGQDATPQAGSYITSLDLDGATVPVEYEFDDDNETNILGVLINGAWVDADKFDSAQRDEWVAAIDDEVASSNTRAKEDAQADAWLEAA